MDDQTTNRMLEEEALGVPLWLHRNDYAADCKEVLQLLAQTRNELFTSSVNRMLHLAYCDINKRDAVPSVGLLKESLTMIGSWSDDSAEGGRVTPGLLDKYAEQGSCQLAMYLDQKGTEFLEKLLGPLKRMSWERRIKATAGDGASELREASPQDFDEKACNMIATLQALYLDKEGVTALIPDLSSLAREELHNIENKEERPMELVKSGFYVLDNAIGGFEPSNLVVIAGRTSMGKTSVGLDIALSAARAGHMVVDFTLEMSSSETARRILAKQTKIDVLKLRARNLDTWQQGDIQRAVETNLPFYIDDRPATPTDIENRCVALLATMSGEPKIDLILIDHLQLLGVSDGVRHESRNRQLSQYTSELKELAKKLRCVVIALSQVNRLSQREKRPPILSDLRDSGSIEENADIVIGIYRPGLDDESASPIEAEMRVMKNRNGPLCKASLIWQEQLARFVNKAHEETASGWK